MKCTLLQMVKKCVVAVLSITQKLVIAVDSSITKKTFIASMLIIMAHALMNILTFVGDEGICLKETVGPIQTLNGSVFWRHRLGVDTKNFTDHGFEMFGFTKSEMEEFREEIAEYAKENLFD